MPFTDRSVIITGAGKGIGRATAILLAERGARVTAISRTQSDLDSLDARADPVPTSMPIRYRSISAIPARYRSPAG